MSFNLCKVFFVLFLFIVIVGQPMQISMGNTMGMSNNPVMAFQRNSIMPSVSSYSESGLSHNITTEDMMGPGIQGIAYIAVCYLVFS